MEGKLVVGEGGDEHEEAGPTLQKEVTVQLEAHQWYWEPETITVPQAAKVRLEITSFAEAEPQIPIHGLGIPAYGISEILPVGETTVVEFVADKAGEFPFDCTAFCGEGHLDMKGKLIVQGADEKEEEKISPANQLDDSPDSSRNDDLIVVVAAAVVVVAVTWWWLWRY